MTPHERLRIDLLVARYLEAIETDDFAVQERLWHRAESEPELVERFRQIHADLIAEHDEAESTRTTETIADVVRSHLPSAEIVQEKTGPVTVADVVEELFRDKSTRLPMDDLATNQKLRSSREQLPDDLGLTALMTWARSKLGDASPEYWRAFRKVALKLQLQRDSEIQFQMAARKAPKPEEPK